MPAAAQDWTERSRELAALLSRTGLGDRAAFAALYERTSAHLFGVVLRIQHDKAQAEDVLQEVYVKVWRSAAGFDVAQSQPLTWLTSIARHGAIDSLRRAGARPQTITAFGALDADAEPTDALDTVADTAAGPLDLLERAASARALTDCIDDLSAPQRQSLAMAFYDGCTHAEVAVRMGQPLGTVKSWVRRALLALKGCLDRAAAAERVAPAER